MDGIYIWISTAITRLFQSAEHTRSRNAENVKIVKIMAGFHKSSKFEQERNSIVVLEKAYEKAEHSRI